MVSSGDNSSFKITLYYKNNLQVLYYIFLLTVMVKQSLLGYYKKYLKVNDQG
jgi:hypothetical protein